MAVSTYMKNAVLDAFFGVGAVVMSLHTADPGTTGTTRFPVALTPASRSPMKRLSGPDQQHRHGDFHEPASMHHHSCGLLEE